MAIESSLIERIKAGVQTLGFSYPEGVSFEEPPAHIEADISTNIALQIARAEGKNPREVAEALKEWLLGQEVASSVEIAGPGFINLTLKADLFLNCLQELQPSQIKDPKNSQISVEYISANPSGPLHIGNARGGPIGETLARIYEKEGFSVTREYYVNDIGGQANVFAASILHYYLTELGQESVFPEKGYPGDYVQVLAQKIKAEKGDWLLQVPAEERLEEMRKEAMQQMIAQVRSTAERMGIHFDLWRKESDISSEGLSAQALEQLKTSGNTLEKEGAIWLKSGIAEDDRETVLQKSDGTFGYFLNDLGYHLDKFEKREVDQAVVVLGANHHGHPARMKAGLKGLGFEPERYKEVFYEYIQLKKDGQTVKMAKRDGTFVTADEVLDEVPLEVFTYFMLSKSNDSHIDFDMQLAKDTSEKNPIYYILYAYARIQSLIQLGKEKGLAPNLSLDEQKDLEPTLRKLIMGLDRYIYTIERIATTQHTHLLAHYLYDLATRFHSFYAAERILTDDKERSEFLLYMCQKTAETLKDGLGLLNIKAQDQMVRT